YLYLKDPKLKHIFSYMLVGVLGFLIHPLFIFVLGLFFFAYLVFEPGFFTFKKLKNPFIASLGIIMINFFWLIPLVASLKYYQPDNVFLQPPGAKALIESFIKPGNIVFNLLFLSGLLCPFLLGKERDKALYRSFGLLSLACFIIAYLKFPFIGHILSNIEPVRFLIIPAVLTVILLARLLSRYFAKKAWVLAGVIIILLLMQIVICPSSNFFFSICLENEKIDHYWINKKTEELAGLIRELTDKSARILIEDSPHRFHNSNIVSLLPALTDREYIGGPYVYPKIKHHFASFSSSWDLKPTLFDSSIDNMSINKLMQYLELYNIKWAIVNSAQAKDFFKNHPDKFKPLASSDRQEIFSVEGDASYFIKGKGIIKAGLGRIDISQASKGDIIIKYHYYEPFKTEPQVEIERADYLEDPIGFIKIKNLQGHRDIQIYQ
ncbi:MAG: hypothetical protein JW867_07965, partial [Candidatus Omnitrophica bacterium]|nr:hypothetical protein [Candidatus Omnitrophota bacterium]